MAYRLSFVGKNHNMFIPNSFLFTGILLSIFFTQCSCDHANGAKSDQYKGSARYDIATPKILNLPVELDEISGLAYYAKDTSVFAIIDEDGVLYKIPIMNIDKTRKWVFDKSRDFEDLVLIDSTFYIMVSNGDIVKLHFEGDHIITDKSDFGTGKKKNEFEAMYVDRGKLIIICKDCSDDKKSITSFHYDMVNKTYEDAGALDLTQLNGKTEKKLKDIKPSAAAINPVTDELYILSSVSKQLLVVNRENKITEVYDLNPKIYKQPEGIAFTPQGDLIISNEVFLEGTATLLILKNKLK